MSKLQVVPSQPCDDLLDFIYGGLTPAKQKAFEEHLATCTNNCKAEVEATQKLRNLAKEALPPVEPSNDRMAAIQAQLLHAAAQRKSGTVIPLFRRIVTHPGFSAAAAMIVVGLYVTTQWGNLKMPAKSSESASAPAAAAPAPAPATATTTPTPAANPAPAAPVLLPKAPAEVPADPTEAAIGGEGTASSDKAKRELSKTEQKADNKPSKELFETRKDAPTDDELWRRKTATAPAPKAEPAAPEAKPAEMAMKKKAKMDADLGDALGVSMPSGAKGGGAVRGEGSGSVSTGTLGGSPGYSSGPGNAGKSQLAQPAKPSAPAPSQGYYEAKVAEERDARGADNAARAGNTKQSARPPATQVAEPAPATAPQAEAPVVVAAPPPAQAQNYAAPQATATRSQANNEQQLRGRNEQSNFSNLGKQSATAESLRRRGDSLARSGKCEDALRAFNDANRVAPSADNNAADQLSYAKCLRESGRYDAAQMALDSLQRQNVQSNAVAVENEVNLLNNQRRQYGAPTAAPSKASKAAPKARSAPASEKNAADSAY